MKSKTIFSVVLTAVLAGAAVSCQDMLSVDSDSVIYEKDNTLNHTYDTIYSLLGIIQRMQSIADRTVVLGEIRGDLVSLTGKESDDLRELYAYDFAKVKETNKYNDPLDYYAVINNCNYFIENADTSFYRNQENVFLKEYISVLGLRAWTYLQLAQAYGRVYYVDKPITSGDQADESKWDLVDIKELAKRLADDILSRFPDEKFLDYRAPHFSLGGNDNDDGTKSQKHSSENIVIPMRLILGDLFLWSASTPEDFAKAAKYYYEYLYHNSKYVATGTNIILWNGYSFMNLGDDTYVGGFGEKATPISYIPMESEQYAGITSDLPNIFNSTKENDYWPQLTYSKSMLYQSARQEYCYHRIIASSGVPIAVYMDKRLQDSPLLKGDLRLQSIFEVKAAKDGDKKSTVLNSSRQTLKKINSEKICLYRKDLVYLRLAEALNRAGMPHMAFGILKYGLTATFIEDSISQVERDKVVDLGISTTQLFPDEYFQRTRFVAYTFPTDGSGSYINNDKNNPVSADYTKPAESTRPEVYNTIGIHSRGSGDSELNERYVIKVNEPSVDPQKDTIRAVEELILNEMALETSFEGYRFGDLMRISMHRALDNGYPGSGGFADNAFLAKRVAARESATMDDPYAGAEGSELYTRLLGNGTALNLNWFLRMRDTKD